jgi:NADH:ubiquinone oxidoreductase subunit C
MNEKEFILYQQVALQTVQTAMLQAQQELPAVISSVRVTPEGILLRTTARKLHILAKYLRNSTMFRFRALTDIAVVDRLLPSGRFVVNYNLLSTTLNQRVTIQLAVSETDSIPSLLGSPIKGERLYPAADWQEREVWDMFGIYFTGHGDLRRILTDYGFTGHPLRKDFPLTGYHELVYNDAGGRVTSEPVELAQEFRVFHL